MNYQVLARKWRPRTFQQMVGQDHILRMLSNALDKQRLHHAYLFTGTRGVGKTTLARILAKCLNCEQSVTATPCLTCKHCTAIEAGRFLDLLEVDAASRTKVEDTRELLDNVQYQPTQGRYKIYLIDEVHMLSQHSFNALLKTLEEPPSYVKFLLATTDPKRLPITILSRCLQFNLKRVSQMDITSHLKHICTAETIAFEEKALPLLANAADGSMRDALSLLDQAIAYCGETITVADTRNMLGTIEHDLLYRLLHALADQDGKSLLAGITQLADLAPDFSYVLETLLSILHRLNVLKVVPETEEISPELLELATRFGAEELQLYYQIALIGRRDLPFAPHPAEGFEMIMLRMLAFQPTQPAAMQSVPETKKIITPKKETKEIPAPATSLPVQPSEWADILGKLGLNGLTYALASNCNLALHTDNNITLALSEQHQPMLNKKLADRIEQALARYLDKPIKLVIDIIANEMSNTPTQQQQLAKTARQTAATEAIKNDLEVQKIMGMFDATLASVTPRSEEEQ